MEFRSKKDGGKSVTLNINKSPSCRIYIQSSNVSESSTTLKDYCCDSSQNTATSKEADHNIKDGCIVSRKNDKKYIKNVTITSRPTISKLIKNTMKIFRRKSGKHCIKIQKMSEAEYLCKKIGAATFAEISNKVNPYCSINFIRHTVPKTTKHLFTCDFFL